MLYLFLACSAVKSPDLGDANRPDLVCPGDEYCQVAGEGPVLVGASAVTITPTCLETWSDDDEDKKYRASRDTFFDCGCDQLCPEDEGYAGPDDGEADGVFQTAWLAGFGNGRAVSSVHDDIWSRTITFRQGDVSLALVSVDLVGYFNDDIQRLNEAVLEAGLDFDHIIISSTHVHSAPDVLGQWGRQLGETGRNHEYLEYLRARIVESIRIADDSAQAARMSVGAIDVATYDPGKGTRNVLHDHRDPKIIDPMLNVATFSNEAGETIATLLNFGNHPEVLDASTLWLTSDFADATRRGVEQGVNYPEYSVNGVGGVCIYISAAVGGMMSPLQVEVTDGSGQSYRESSFEKSDALGNVMAELALQALSAAEPEPLSLAFARKSFDIAVENVLFQAAIISGMLEREMKNYEPGEVVVDEKPPIVETEVNIVDLGPIRLQTIPGELLPELAIGGYDPADGQPGSPLEELIGEDNPNPPDLSLAPAGPYLKQRMGGKYNWIIGLGNDELGYFIPDYNYQLDDRSPYLIQALGDHYEETNSLGPSATGTMEVAVNELLDWWMRNPR